MAIHSKIINKVLASSQRGEESPSGGFAPTAGKTGFADFPHGYSNTGFQPVQFPPSVQSDLFNYLRPEQQEFVKPILRVLKKPAQEELCCALLDYLESGEVIPPADISLGGMFYYITRAGMTEDDPQDRRILRPLHYREPKHIGTIIKQIFNK